MTVPVGYAYDASHRTDRQYPAPAGADRRHARSGRGTAWIGRPRDPVRRRRAGHPAAFRGDGFAGRDRRRAAQAELRDVSGRRTHEPRAGRRDHSVRGRPHPPAPAPDVRPVPLRDAGLGIRRRRATPHAGKPQAGGHLRLGAEPAVPGGRPAGLPARGVHRGPRRPGRRRDPRLPGSRRGRPDRLHRGAPVAEARPVGRAAERVRGPEQPGPRRADGRATGAGRGPHLPGR